MYLSSAPPTNNGGREQFCNISHSFSHLIIGEKNTYLVKFLLNFIGDGEGEGDKPHW